MIIRNHSVLTAVMAVAILAIATAAPADDPSHDAFTYQGQLRYDGSPVAGPVELRFRLYDAAIAGDQIGAELVADAFDDFDDEGRFTIELEFGKGVFDGTQLWLEIDVDGNTLSPRQPITPAPYAIRALNATQLPTGGPWPLTSTLNIADDTLVVNPANGRVGIGTSSPSFQFTVSRTPPSNNINPVALFRQEGPTNSAGAIRFQNTAGNHFNIGITHTGHFAIGPNANIGLASDVLRLTSAGNLGVGVTNPQATLHVADGTSGTGVILPGLRITQNTSSPNVIGGHAGNFAADGVVGASIGGGGSSFGSNRVTAEYGTVGGGENNIASDTAATISGGSDNSAGGLQSTVGGGASNAASGSNATVAGGHGNTATALRTTVGGGAANAATGAYATVPGGQQNVAAGFHSFAAGARAHAIHEGAFVWADRALGATDPLASTATNQVTFRSRGGFRIFTNLSQTSGVHIAPGGSSWLSLSDRNMKENFAEVDARDVLERIAAMPILTWNYKSQDASIRHMGPMAQDFWAAFGLGEDELRISTINADGVLFAAVQGLHGLVQERDAEIESLRDEVDALHDRIAQMEAMLRTLAQDGGAQ